MRTAGRGRGLCAVGAAAALAALLLFSAPSSASAQIFTLTFDSPQPTGSAGTVVSTSTATLYQNASTGWNGLVKITDGWVSGFSGFNGGFGTGLGASYGGGAGNCDNGSGGCLIAYQTGSMNGTTGVRYGVCCSDHVPRAGEFLFTPQGNNAVNFVSVDLKNTVAAPEAMTIELWGLTCACDVANYAVSLGSLGTQTVALAAFTYVGPGGSNYQKQLSGGFRFEWGTPPFNSTANYTATHAFVIDNLTFQNFVPEPGTIVLFGTGLVAVGPLLVRRRRRKT